jgi:hypothetical protein
MELTAVAECSFKIVSAFGPSVVLPWGGVAGLFMDRRNPNCFRIAAGNFNAGTLPLCSTAPTTATLTVAVARQSTAIHFCAGPRARKSSAAGPATLTTIKRMPANLLEYTRRESAAIPMIARNSNRPKSKKISVFLLHV